MLIVCPSCATTYTLTEAQMGQGRTLRCAQCRHTWHASPADAVDGDGAMAALPQPALAATAAADDGGAAAFPLAVEDHAPPGKAGPAHKARSKASRPARHKPARRKGRPSLLTHLEAARPWQLALVGAAVALIAAILFREPLVRAAPQTARLFAAIGLPVNLRGLALDAVRSEIIADKDQTVLVVEGTIRNLRKAETSVPVLALSLRGPDGGEVYGWTAEAAHTVLAAGESTPFRTRVVTPALDGRDVLVRFARIDDSAPAVH